MFTNNNLSIESIRRHAIELARYQDERQGIVARNYKTEVSQGYDKVLGFYDEGWSDTGITTDDAEADLQNFMNIEIAKEVLA